MPTPRSRTLISTWPSIRSTVMSAVGLGAAAVAHRVVEQVVEHLAEHQRVEPHRQLVLLLVQLEMQVRSPVDRPGMGRVAPQVVAQLDVLHHHVQLLAAVVHLGGAQDVGDQPVQAVDVERIFSTKSSRSASARSMLAQGLGEQLDRGERRVQLVRHRGAEVRLLLAEADLLEKLRRRGCSTAR